MKRIILSCLAVLFGISLAAQTAMLRMNPEKNKVYKMRSVSEQTVTQTMNGNQQTTNADVTYVMSLRMMDSTPDFIVAEVHFDTLSTRTNAMGMVINSTSTSEGDIKSTKTEDILSYVMNRISKNPMFVKLDFTGKPIEVVNSKMISDMVLKDTGSITLEGIQATAIKSQLMGMVSDNNLKTIIEGFTWCLPGRQIRQGEEWNISQKTTSGGMMLDINTTYHLNNMKENYADVTVESAIKASENAAPIKSGGATVTYGNLQGLSKGSMIIDTNTGLVVSNKAKTHITGDLGISAPGFSMNIPMDISGESYVETLK